MLSCIKQKENIATSDALYWHLEDPIQSPPIKISPTQSRVMALTFKLLGRNSNGQNNTMRRVIVRSSMACFKFS